MARETAAPMAGPEEVWETGTPLTVAFMDRTRIHGELVAVSATGITLTKAQRVFMQENYGPMQRERLGTAFVPWNNVRVVVSEAPEQFDEGERRSKE